MHNQSRITKKPFGNLPNGEEVMVFTLSNRNGMELQVMNWGATIVSIKTPNRGGVIEDIALAFDNLDQYVNENPYIGCIVGRYGNRIADGKFSLDGKVYSLPKNDKGHHLHGGFKGFDKVFWNLEELPTSEGKAVKLSYLSKDGEEGYPGNLNTEVVYLLTDNNELHIRYTATTDKKTIVNLTQHTYFNLSADFNRPIFDHELMLVADTFVPVSEKLMPTGELKNVEGTPFDFRTPMQIGARMQSDDPQLKLGLGYDSSWMLARKDGLKLAATLYEKTSGRFMEVLTTEPAIQFYTGNFLNGEIGLRGASYKKHHGLCLETHHPPDSPNQPSFPSVVLNPGNQYSTQTIYRFSTR